MAHYLQSLGVEPETVVGLFVRRSLEMIVGLLGVLKAGAAYVPLDVKWPQKRLQQVLSSTQVNIIITEKTHLATVRTLQWHLAQLKHVVSLDIDTPVPLPESLDEDAVQRLWNLVAEQATDRVTAGGFFSSYTGDPFNPDVVGNVWC